LLGLGSRKGAGWKMRWKVFKYLLGFSRRFLERIYPFFLHWKVVMGVVHHAYFPFFMHTIPFQQLWTEFFCHGVDNMSVPSSLGSRTVGVMRVQLIMPQFKTSEIFLSVFGATIRFPWCKSSCKAFQNTDSFWWPSFPK